MTTLCARRYPCPVADEDPVRAFAALPQRVYLDTCTLQTTYEFDGVIFESEPFEPFGRAARIEGLGDELEALRKIFIVTERAMYEFVITETSLREVVARDCRGYTQWVHDIRDPWLIQSAGYETPPWGSTFYQPRFGMISKKDRILLQDALDLGCDGFMTVEKKLPKIADHIMQWTGLRVMRPTSYWELLRPSAALYS
jgi:hypothetical protein